MKAWNYITINFHQDVGQEYSKIVQIIVKADRGKAIAWRSVSYKMTCYHIQDEKTLQILSLHFVPTLQSAVYILYLVYIFYPVCSLLSAFCTNRYPWHQYSLFLFSIIRTTHTIYHRIPVCELIRHFRSFPRWYSSSLLYNWRFQVIHPPPKYNSCMHSMPMFSRERK